MTVADTFGEYAREEGTKEITFPAFDNSETFEIQTNRFRHINTEGSINVSIV